MSKYQKEEVTHRIWEGKASRIGRLDRFECTGDNTAVDESAGNEPPSKLRAASQEAGGTSRPLHPTHET